MGAKVDRLNKNSVTSIFSGVIVSVAVTLILILVFALLIKFFNISDGAIFPVNQVIKIVSLFIGILTVVKMSRTKGFLKGIILGILYYLLSYIVFSLLQGGFSFSINNVYDFLLTSLMGGLIGIITINIIR